NHLRRLDNRFQNLGGAKSAAHRAKIGPHSISLGSKFMAVEALGLLDDLRPALAGSGLHDTRLEHFFRQDCERIPVSRPAGRRIEPRTIWETLSIKRSPPRQLLVEALGVSRYRRSGPFARKLVYRISDIRPNSTRHP